MLSVSIDPDQDLIVMPAEKIEARPDSPSDSHVEREMKDPDVFFPVENLSGPVR